MKTIFTIRLEDGTLFHSNDLGEVEEYWNAHRDAIRYLRDYYDKDVFERDEHPEKAGGAE